MELYDNGRWSDLLKLFCSTITEAILKKREKYPVKWYCTFGRETENALLSGDWREACPAYGSRNYFHKGNEKGFPSIPQGISISSIEGIYMGRI